MEQYLIGIDLGGTTTRAAVFDTKGKEISVVGRPTELVLPQPGFTERDLNEFRETTFSCIREAVNQAEIDRRNIIGISLSGHGKGLYLLDRNAKPLCNGIISTDTRGTEYMRKWTIDGTLEKVRQLTFQGFQVSQPCILLRWFKDNRRDIYDRIGYVLECKDYIRYCLTGEIYAEYTDCSGTNLLNLRTRDYDRNLLEYFGIVEVERALPPLKNSFDICGYLTEEASEKCGLVAGIPVAGGMFDIDACAIASGIVDSRDVCAIAGTWSINEYISREPVLDGSVSFNSLYCIPGFYLIEESSPTSAGNLSWYINSVLSEDCDSAKKKGESVYAAIDFNAEKIDTDGVYFLPYVFGSQFSPKSRGAFIGLDSTTDKYVMAKAVMEGVAFNHKAHINKLIKARGTNEIKQIRLAGGATHSNVWLHILANIINIPILMIDCNELGALGACITAAVAVEKYKTFEEAIENMVTSKYIIYPDTEAAERYAERFKVFMSLEEKLRGM